MNSTLLNLACAILSIGCADAEPASRTPGVLIGNFLRDSPCGIAWVIDDSAAFVLDTRGPYVAGTAALDDSYHAYRFAHGGANIMFEWGRFGDNAVGRLSSDQNIDLALNLSGGWPGWTSIFSATPDGASGTAQAAGGRVDWTLRTSPVPKSTSSSNIIVSITPSAPARFVAGVKVLPGFESVDGMLDKARGEYEANRPKASGDLGDFIGAIENNINNSKLYSSDNHRIAYSVSRGWSTNANGCPYFCWDSFLTANLGAINDPVVARDTVRAMLSYQSPEGLVPNYAHWRNDYTDARGSVSWDRSQPPLASLCVWKMHERYPGDRDFLREIYPRLVKWHDWWMRFRNATRDGLLEWGSATGDFQAAQYETGWDDNLHFAGAKMRGTTMNAYAADLSAMWSMDAHYLELISAFLGEKSDAARFRGEHAEMNKRINDRLWNTRLNCYCSRFWDDASPDVFLTRLTPMNFYPLSAGAPNKDRAHRALQVLTDPAKFWGRYLLPTLAYDDPDYHQQEYWRGDVWGPPNYIMWQGIEKYAPPPRIAEYAERNVDLFMRNWLAKGVCGENYLSTAGTQSSDAHYTWGALLCLVGLESIVDVDDAGRIVLNGAQTKSITLKNIPLLGRTYDVKTTPGSAALIRDGKVILSANGQITHAKIE